MEIRKIFLLTFIVMANTLYSQRNVLDSYPYQQNFYVGGLDGLKREMVKIVKEQNILPCERSDEKYTIEVLVNEDSSINYIRNSDTLMVHNNKCAFDISLKVISYLKEWIPAKVNNVNVAAIAKIKIDPFQLYHSKEDPSKNEIKRPVYKKGMEDFEYRLGVIFKDKMKVDEHIKVDFTVNEAGIIENVKITGEYSDIEKRNLGREISQTIKGWIPATFNGIPIKSTVGVPISRPKDPYFTL